MAEDPQKEAALKQYVSKVQEHRGFESRIKKLRETVGELTKEFDKTEDDLQALQSVGQIIGEVLRQLDEERFIVKASSGPRYVVTVRTKLEKVIFYFF